MDRSRSTLAADLLLLAGIALLAAPASAVTMDWVVVGDPGNAPDTPTNCFAADCGSVPYTYKISKYEVTNAQYAEFLNAKAASDPLGLYNSFMGNTLAGGITRSGADGSYTYSARAGFENRPVNFVSVYDAMRFTNWMNNGQGSADTETGVYTLLGGTATPSNGETVTRNPGSIVFLPTENEWYKAAYYDGLTGTYFDSPTGTDVPTACAAPGATANTGNCGLFTVFSTSNVGAYTGSASPYGTYDQGGNVEEWNEQIVDDLRGFRGGAWDRGAELFLADASNAGTGWSEYTNIGFRLAMVPEPGTALLVLAGLAGIAWRRKS